MPPPWQRRLQLLLERQESTEFWPNVAKCVELRQHTPERKALSEHKYKRAGHIKTNARQIRTAPKRKTHHIVVVAY